MMLSLFGILTFIFAVQTLRMNRALQARSPRPHAVLLSCSEWPFVTLSPSRV